MRYEADDSASDGEGQLSLHNSRTPRSTVSICRIGSGSITAGLPFRGENAEAGYGRRGEPPRPAESINPKPPLLQLDSCRKKAVF